MTEPVNEVSKPIMPLLGYIGSNQTHIRHNSLYGAKELMNKRMRQKGIETRKKIYDFLIEFITQNGYSPSIREICEGVGLASTSSIYHHLFVLEDMGKIHMKENKTRAISIVGYEFKKSEV